jgi:outer membrane protein OmpA-like peptidoglycan-associated protein
MTTVRPKAAFAAACMVAGLILAGLGSAIAQYADQQSLEDQISSALRAHADDGDTLTRGLSVSQPDPKKTDQQKFINALRVRSISVASAGNSSATASLLSPDDRAKVAEITSDRPQIDLEIYFDYNSAVVGPKAVPTLLALGNALTRSEFKGSVFFINGYTDARGTPEYNLLLSQQRASAVRTLLIEQFHIPPDTLIAVGFGKENLKIPGQPSADQNRRVQIVNTEVKAAATGR